MRYIVLKEFAKFRFAFLIAVCFCLAWIFFEIKGGFNKFGNAGYAIQILFNKNFTYNFLDILNILFAAVLGVSSMFFERTGARIRMQFHFPHSYLKNALTITVIPLCFLLVVFAAQRLEAVDVRINSKDVVVGSQLNEELKKAGFKHGAKAYFLNPSIMKGFDEGGFLIDSDDKIFHLKFKDGKFSAVDTKIKKPGIVNIVVIENERREFYAVLIAKDGLGLISYDNYAYVPLPSVGYDYAASDLYLKITPEYKMLAFSDEEAIYTYVTNLKYELEKQNFTRTSKPISDRALKRYVFPFEAHIAQKEGAYRFEFKNFAPQSVFVSLILAFAFFAYNLRFYKRRVILESAFVLIFGIYGFIAMIFYNTNKGKI